MSEETDQFPIKFFCKTSYKEVPTVKIVETFKKMGVEAGLTCFAQLPPSHPKCKPMPMDKQWDKENLDDYGMPTLKSRTLKEISTEKRAELELAGARRYLSYTQWYVDRYNANGTAIPDDILAKRAEMIAKLDAAEG